MNCWWKEAVELYLGEKAFQMEHVCWKRSQSKGWGDWEDIGSVWAQISIFDLILKEVGGGQLHHPFQSPHVRGKMAWPGL